MNILLFPKLNKPLKKPLGYLKNAKLTTGSFLAHEMWRYMVLMGQWQFVSKEPDNLNEKHNILRNKT